MSADPVSIMGIFTSERRAAAAIDRLRASSWTIERVHSPIPSHAILDALKPPKSKVGWFTLAGGITGVLRIEGIGYFDPDIVTFYGTDQQRLKTQLIQHVSQLSVTLRAIPKAALEEEPRRVGFRLAEDLAKD